MATVASSIAASTKRAVGAFAVLVAFVTVMVGVQPSPAGANHLPAVWVGAPIEGRWAAYASSLPASHGIYYGGDWSVDLPGAAGQVVTVFAAPQNGSTSVRARIDRITNACAPRAGETAAQTRARGGERIEVGIYTGTTKIGFATYAHVNPSASARSWLTNRTWISRWNTNVGTVGRYTANSCWDGTHVHFELYSSHAYACYNKGWRLGQVVHRTNFLGFTGGNFASAPRRACP